MNMRHFFIITVVLLLFSCSKQNDNRCLTLLLDPKSSEYTDDRFLIDSINVIYDDSLKIIRHTGDYQFESRFHQDENGIYEIRERCNEELDCFGTDTILTFYKSDTTFIYHSAYKFIPLVFFYTLADCKYEIISIDNNYKTIKQSIIDTTYKEIFFYDKNYHIYKYVNTWKDNKCVYIKKE
ncbi:MAG: hypothetical protein LBU51_01950 [Bacteroidales bacterium]|jgi:hypothetical protein|nr:hypothetical protein [Bacteroidales bacterium]